ncbi:MAG: hypothetical protein CML20_18695 [Rheinheimera sp.]|nr:hypothetical protein [Rheinheimera sp.]
MQVQNINIVIPPILINTWVKVLADPKTEDSARNHAFKMINDSGIFKTPASLKKYMLDNKINTGWLSSIGL